MKAYEEELDEEASDFISKMRKERDLPHYQSLIVTDKVIMETWKSGYNTCNEKFEKMIAEKDAINQRLVDHSNQQSKAFCEKLDLLAERDATIEELMDVIRKGHEYLQTKRTSQDINDADRHRFAQSIRETVSQEDLMEWERK